MFNYAVAEYFYSYLDVEICKEGRFKSLAYEIDNYDIIGKYYCLKDDYNFTIFGSYSSF